MKVSLGNGEMGVSPICNLARQNHTFFYQQYSRFGGTARFDQLRIEGLLCDVALVPGDGDEIFPVHRAMMASASDYFKAMFTGGMKEQDLMCIKLRGVNKVGLKKIIDFYLYCKAFS